MLFPSVLPLLPAMANVSSVSHRGERERERENGRGAEIAALGGGALAQKLKVELFLGGIAASNPPGKIPPLLSSPLLFSPPRPSRVAGAARRGESLARLRSD